MQRENMPCRLLLVDNFDSFTFNIYDYLCRLGASVKVISRDLVTSKDIQWAEGIVLSPGPGNPENIPVLQNLISDFVEKKPVLGICLGHQALAFHFGATLRKAAPMHGKISLVKKINAPILLNNLPASFRVVRYHSLLVEDLPSDLMPLLETEDHFLMAFQHRQLPVMGIQFHPEAHLSEFGLQLLKNWLDVCVKNQGAFFSPDI
jgi:anthranilate synthase component 2